MVTDGEISPPSQRVLDQVKHVATLLWSAAPQSVRHHAIHVPNILLQIFTWLIFCVCLGNPGAAGAR